ncbi:MAG: glycoside hydrolase family 15 protein [Candidatus Staskawiczbacteria bacterium]|nr:glycoside hydrolase family 15 protein [Candidatus Staskawiczbacteria bacterium]
MSFLDNVNFANKIFRINEKEQKRTRQKKSSIGYKPLERYGIIGNLETIALIASDGSIDWMCLPHLESESVFASLLDKEKGGFFRISPRSTFTSIQQYDGHTNILKTKFTCSTGTGELIDFMPPFKKSKYWHKQQILFRKLKCSEGYMPWGLVFQPRFKYASKKTEITNTDTGVLATYEQEKLYLDSPLFFKIDKIRAEADFTLSAGEEIWITMQYGFRNSFDVKSMEGHLRKTYSFWDNWRHKCEPNKCVFAGAWHDLVIRSGLVLKLLTHGETGAIAAAATTSLPEKIGGSRNWDYRFNWLRDSVFTVQALYNLGNKKEAKALFNWYKRLYKGIKISDIQIAYGLHGEKIGKEKILKHLSGYKNSKPVRIGNLANSQQQLDVYGEILNVAFETSRYGEGLSKNDWKFLKKIVNHVCMTWKSKDSGIWEQRGKKKHFVYSKVMCWVAIDRGIKIAEKKQFTAPIQQWIKFRDEIYYDILKNGFDKKLNSFVQSYNTKNLDASNLLIPIAGFLPFDDPKVKGTIDATLKYLVKNGLVFRYKSKDGLPGKEGSFIFCTFWLIDCLALSGQIQKAEKMYTNLLQYISPLGLFSEEIDISQKFMVGNFPQAFSHVGLINSALYIGIGKGKKTPGPKPLGIIGNRIISMLSLKYIFKRKTA